VPVDPAGPPAPGTVRIGLVGAALVVALAGRGERGRILVRGRAWSRHDVVEHRPRRASLRGRHEGGNDDPDASNHESARSYAHALSIMTQTATDAQPARVTGLGDIGLPASGLVDRTHVRHLELRPIGSACVEHSDEDETATDVPGLERPRDAARAQVRTGAQRAGRARRLVSQERGRLGTRQATRPRGPPLTRRAPWKLFARRPVRPDVARGTRQLHRSEKRTHANRRAVTRAERILDRRPLAGRARAGRPFLARRWRRRRG
jgi:hypothetical protein